MSGGNKSTTTQQTTPFGNTQGLLTSGLTQAQNLFGTGKLAPYAGISNTTRGGLAEVVAAGNVGKPALWGALNTAGNFSKGQGAVGTGGQDQVFGAAMGPSNSEQNLAGIARGDLLGRNDADFERLLSGVSEKAATAARMAAGANGRYGGDYAQDAVARAVGDVESGYRVNQLNTERDRMMQANSMLDQFRQSGLNLGLNAANSRSSIQSANSDRQLGATQAIPGLYEAAMSPYRSKVEAGRIMDADAQARADVPGNNLAALMQILGASSPYATQTATTKGPNNTLSQVLGGGLGLASLLFG